MSERQWGFKTRSLHAGSSPDPQTGARAVPIYQTSAFVFETALNNVDLPTLGKPTIPHFNPIYLLITFIPTY